jgi:hypothetical protein
MSRWMWIPLGVGMMAAPACGDGTGRIHLSWTVTADGQRVDDCNQVGASNVEVALLSYTSLDDFHHYDAVFPCNDFQGTTVELPAASYSASVDLVDAARHRLDSAGRGGIQVTSGEVAEVDDLMFAFGAGAMVQLRLRVDFGVEGGPDCYPELTEVYREEIDLEDVSGGACLSFPVTGFSRDGGPFASETCGSTIPCVEPNVTQIIALPTGSYQLQVEGFVPRNDAPLLCYQLAQPMPVVLDHDLDLTIQVPAIEDPQDATDCPR